jgi:hypothetical protein
VESRVGRRKIEELEYDGVIGDDQRHATELSEEKDGSRGIG